MEHQERFSKIINFNCDKCDNTGYVFDKTDMYYKEMKWVDEEGIEHLEPVDGVKIKCSCAKMQKVKKSILTSTLKSSFETYSIEKFKTPTQSLKGLKEHISTYIKGLEVDSRDEYDRRYWLLLHGDPGKGKSHICTYTYLEGLLSGLSGEYLKYVDVIPKLEKENMSGYVDVRERAEKIIEHLKTVDMLYIDDFLKTGYGLKLAWEIINSRYTDKNLITIISTELDYNQISQLENSDSMASRIYERCNQDKYFIGLGKTIENWRRK